MLVITGVSLVWYFTKLKIDKENAEFDKAAYERYADSIITVRTYERDQEKKSKIEQYKKLSEDIIAIEKKTYKLLKEKDKKFYQYVQNYNRVDSAQSATLKQLQSIIDRTNPE